MRSTASAFTVLLNSLLYLILPSLHFDGLPHSRKGFILLLYELDILSELVCRWLKDGACLADSFCVMLLQAQYWL